MVEYFREGARPRVPLSAKRGRTANVRLVANFSRNAKKADEVIRRAIYQRLLPLFFERPFNPNKPSSKPKREIIVHCRRTMGKWLRNDPLRARPFRFGDRDASAMIVAVHQRREGAVS